MYWKKQKKKFPLLENYMHVVELALVSFCHIIQYEYILQIY